jgi:hypothetical protein
MRARDLVVAALALATVAACVSMPMTTARQDACRAMNGLDPWGQPCLFARLLAICAGLPAEEQRRIQARCEAELAR